jgi:hypothetical protein
MAYTSIDKETGMTKLVTKVWQFSSSSNPSKSYETLQYSDGSTSCNCMGWTRRVAADGSRTCKHTRAVDMGTADSECTSSHDYQSATVTARPAAVPKVEKKVKKPVMEAAVPARKVVWK